MANMLPAVVAGLMHLLAFLLVVPTTHVVRLRLLFTSSLNPSMLGCHWSLCRAWESHHGQPYLVYLILCYLQKNGC